MCKRILSLVLALVMTLSLCPAVSAGNSGNDKSVLKDYWNIDGKGVDGQRTIAPSDSSTFSTAHVRNYRTTSGSNNGSNNKLEVVVNLRDNSQTINHYVCAVVFRASDLTTALKDGKPEEAPLTGTSFYNLNIKTGQAANYYAIGKGKWTAGGGQITLPLYVPSSAASAALDTAGADESHADLTVRTFPTPGVTGADPNYNYYDEYIFVVFGTDKTGQAANYYMDHFYLDSNGYVRTSSYMVKYNGNSPRDYTGWGNQSAACTVPPTISRTVWDETKLGSFGDPATLKLAPSNQRPSAGSAYTFLGWTTSPQAPLLADETPEGKSITVYPSGGDFPLTLATGGLDNATDVYALWQRNDVEFGESAIPEYQAERDRVEYTGNKAPQVGKNFSTGAFNLTYNPGSGNTYTITVITEGKEDTPSVYTINTNKTETIDYGLTVAVANSSVGNPDRNSPQGRWAVGGAANAHSDGKSVTIRLDITNMANNSTDSMTIYFDQIQKGEQAKPTADANTGLQGRIREETVKKETITKVPVTDEGGNPVYEYTEVTGEPPADTPLYGERTVEGAEPTTEYFLLDETNSADYTGKKYTRAQKTEDKVETKTETVTDGQMYGFYTLGPIVSTADTNTETGYFQTDSKNTPGINASALVGAGTMTNYYLTQGMIFEYMPADQKDVTGLPNKGWREVPLPESWYKDEAQLAAMKDTLGTGSQKVLYSSITAAGNITTAGTATVDATKTPEGFTGWPETYGSIEFEEGLPVLKGLTVGADYKVRFRETANSSASAEQMINISGGSGGGGATAKDFAAVVFYDWDGVLIGSIVAPLGDASAEVTAFEQREDVAALLKSHAGYDFLTWVKNEDDIPTSYGKRVSSTANVDVVDLELDQKNKVDLTNVSESITVKAAYTTNSECILGTADDPLTNRDARRYTTSISSYGRFGIGDSFSVTIKVERGAVPRPTSAALRVRMEIGGVSVYNLYPLSGADVEYVEVAPYAVANKSSGFNGVAIVEWTVIDTYGVSDWIGAGARTTESECQTKASFTVKTVGTSTTTYAVWDEGTYPFYGVAEGLNDALRSYHEMKLQNPDLTPSNSNMGGVTTGILRSAGIPPKVTNTLQLRNALYEGWLGKGLDSKTLTSEELYDVIYEIASGQPRPK